MGGGCQLLNDAQHKVLLLLIGWHAAWKLPLCTAASRGRLPMSPDACAAPHVVPKLNQSRVLLLHIRHSRRPCSSISNRTVLASNSSSSSSAVPAKARAGRNGTTHRRGDHSRCLWRWCLHPPGSLHSRHSKRRSGWELTYLQCEFGLTDKVLSGIERHACRHSWVPIVAVRVCVRLASVHVRVRGFACLLLVTVGCSMRVATGAKQAAVALLG